MKILRVKIRAASSYASPLHSDTLFGAFCWAYKYRFGEGELLDMIKMYKTGSPCVIFSNVFPEGLLPMPLLPIPMSIDQTKTKAEKLTQYQAYKKIKKLNFITVDKFNHIINGIYETDKIDKPTVEVVRLGNMINRWTGTVAEFEETGALFERHETYPKKDMMLFVRIRDGWHDIFEKLIGQVFETGIGADKSVGKGVFKVIDIEEDSMLKMSTEPNGFVVLSNYIPASSDPVKGYYKSMVKYGKLDRDYSATDKPFKKPLVMITEGSVFYDNDVKEYYGRIVTNVSNLNSNIVHCGIAFTVPIKIKKNLETT